MKKTGSTGRVSVLFVCMGNICRSPTAHGVFRKLVDDAGLSHVISIDSAGTHAYHVGNPPDGRSQATALSRGIEMSDLRARQVQRDDFALFDYILAMDSDNYNNLLAIASSDMKKKIRFFMEFAEDTQVREVPDPYYGGASGFERVFDLVEKAASGLLEDIRQRHL